MNNGLTPDELPLVSVVIPTYNRAHYIGYAIESVLQQTYPNIEVIVIDDGSTDDTQDIVKRFAPEVRYVWQENSERGASRNHGLRLAKGEFISFLDSDDLWLWDKLAHDVQLLMANPGVALVCSDALLIDGEGSQIRLIRAHGHSGRVTDKLLQKNFVIMATHLTRTELIREIGGFHEERQLCGSEDWEMWVRLSLVADFAYAPRVTAKVRTHSANTMSDAAGMQQSMARAAELLHASEHLSSRYGVSLRRMDAMIALVNAINYCSPNNRAKAFNFLREAFSTDARIIFDPRFAYTALRILGWRRS